MQFEKPGMNPKRILRLIRKSIERCDLRLENLVILTEAASGAFIVTPLIAAMAGAKHVYALAKSSRWGLAEEIAKDTYFLAEMAGVKNRIEVITEKSKEIVEKADIVTNSGHVRPIDKEMIGWMKPTAVIPLMYEAWEFRETDVDLAACRVKGIAVAGTNERHPDIDVFSFLGVMVIQQLIEAGLDVWGINVLLLCDNPFEEFLTQVLTKSGVTVRNVKHPREIIDEDIKDMDAVIIAATPPNEIAFEPSVLKKMTEMSPGFVVVQFWGDINRKTLYDSSVPVWPLREPKKGHMGILPSEIGPDPVVRLQTGGLKVGEILTNSNQNISKTDLEYIQEINAG